MFLVMERPPRARPLKHQPDLPWLADHGRQQIGDYLAVHGAALPAGPKVPGPFACHRYLVCPERDERMPKLSPPLNDSARRWQPVTDQREVPEKNASPQLRMLTRLAFTLNLRHFAIVLIAMFNYVEA
jgi:hypothetical protein